MIESVDFGFPAGGILVVFRIEEELLCRVQSFEQELCVPRLKFLHFNEQLILSF